LAPVQRKELEEKEIGQQKTTISYENGFYWESPDQLLGNPDQAQNSRQVLEEQIPPLEMR